MLRVNDHSVDGGLVRLSGDVLIYLSFGRCLSASRPSPNLPVIPGFLGCPCLASPLTPAPPRPLCCRGRGWNPRSRRPSGLPKVTQQESPLPCIHSFLTHSMPDGVCGPDLCRHWGKGTVAETEQTPAPRSAETQGASNDTNRLKSIQGKRDPWKLHGEVTVTARGLERQGRGVSGGAGQPLEGAALG